MRDVVSWVTQMRLSAPPRPQLFLPVRQISHVWLLKTPSPPFLVHQSHILRCICVSREKMPIFATTYRWLVLQVPTRRAAVTSTVSSATTTARTRTRWGCTREPRIFIRLQCNMCNGQCKQEKVSEDIGRDEQDIENWKKISTIERCAGGGTQAAAPKAGQHHGCRWSFLISTRSYSFVVNFAPFICLLINFFRFWEVHANTVLFNARVQSQWETNPLPLQVSLPLSFTPHPLKPSQICSFSSFRKCQYAVLGLSQMEAHKYRHLNE